MYNKKDNYLKDQNNEHCSVSVVIPCYNEQESIAEVITELNNVINSITNFSFEIIVIDDGSTDKTHEILKNLQNNIRRLQVVRTDKNAGQSAAIALGIKTANGNYIITMDADGQNDPNDIPHLLADIKNYSCVCGFRENRMDKWSKKIASRIGNAVRNMVLKENIYDSGCTLKIFDANIAKKIMPWKGMHRFMPSLIMMHGGTIKQVPVNHRPRFKGKSKYTNIGRIGGTLMDLYGVYWLKKKFLK